MLLARLWLAHAAATLRLRRLEARRDFDRLPALIRLRHRARRRVRRIERLIGRRMERAARAGLAPA